MREVEIYLVSDYNPKYLDGPIKSAIKRIMFEVKSDLETIAGFTISVEDKVEGLSQNSAKAVLNMTVTTDSEDTFNMVEELNGCLRSHISTQAIYSVTATSSSGMKQYT